MAMDIRAILVNMQAELAQVLATLPTPTRYKARSDRTVVPLPPLPTLGPAGTTIADPIFGSPILRVTDDHTRADAPGVSFRTPDAATAHGWAADGSAFWCSCTDGSTRLFVLDPVRVAAAMVSPQLPFISQPEFDDVNPLLIYGVGTPINHVTMMQVNAVTGLATELIDLTTVGAPPNTYTNAVSIGGGKLAVLYGGAAQDLHNLILIRPFLNPTAQIVLNTLTLSGLGFHCHSQCLDKTGRYLILFPSSADLAAKIATSETYIVDLSTLGVVRLPSDWGGHTVPGYGVLVNQDVASGPWDAAQWSVRSLATPLAPTNLISPILTPPRDPNVVGFGEHSSWGAAQPGTLQPLITGTYLYGDRSQWRAWDEEILAITTDGSSIVNRFGHHRSLVMRDSNPAAAEFVYEPRPCASPDGRWAMFTSNWGKTLGTDPATGLARTDVFLMALS